MENEIGFSRDEIADGFLDVQERGGGEVGAGEGRCGGVERAGRFLGVGWERGEGGNGGEGGGGEAWRTKAGAFATRLQTHSWGEGRRGGRGVEWVGRCVCEGRVPADRMVLRKLVSNHPHLPFSTHTPPFFSPLSPPPEGRTVSCKLSQDMREWTVDGPAGEPWNKG
ncbi:unnamed protein product [Closterium sp. NIES-65]|nr:unnamed protein product [Closterium sp. NIES-65]